MAKKKSLRVKSKHELHDANHPSHHMVNIFAVILAVLLSIYLFFALGSPTKKRVTNFAECEAAGYSILESYPRQCIGPDGHGFTEVVGERFETISEGDGATISGANHKSALIKTQLEWEKLWSALNSDINPRLSVPLVDFNKSVVVTYFMGQRPTSGYGVSITGIELVNGNLAVSVRETEPSPGCITNQVLTNPYQIVVIHAKPSDVKSNEFSVTKTSTDCSQD